jgi:uncharacterized repeat protein (TIGR01451 family)
MVTAEIADCPGSAYAATSNSVVATAKAVAPESLALSVTVTHTPPGSPGINTAITYKVIVANVGASQVDRLEVWNILPSAVVYDSYSTTNGSLTWDDQTIGTISWHGNFTMIPGDSVTIYVNGTTDECTVGNVTDSSQAKGYNKCASVTTKWAADTFYHASNGIVLSVTTTRSVAVPRPDDVIEYRIVATNKSPVWVLDNISVTSNLGLTLPGLVLQSWTATGGLTYALEGLHTWSGAVTLNPGDSVTVFESVIIPCQMGAIANYFTAYASNAPCGTYTAYSDDRMTLDPVLAGSVSAPATINVGDTFDATVSLLNKGGITATIFVTNFNAVSGAVKKIGGPSPAGPIAIPGGGTRTITWTYSVYGAGDIAFSVTAIGMDSCGQDQPVTWSGAGVFPVRFAKLTGALSADRPVLGKAFNIILNVKNEGTLEAKAVVPGIKIDPGFGLVHMVSAPATADIPAGETRAFTWVYSAIGMGQVGFRGYAQGTGGGAPVSTVATALAGIQPPDSLPIGQVQVGMQAAGTADQVYINPRRGDTYSFVMRPSGPGTVSVKIYNMRGAKVRELTRDVAGSDQISIPFNGRDSSGGFLPTGAYYALVAGPGLKFRTWIAVVN